MKKVLLLSCLVGSAFLSNAQLAPSGASPYTQNFNSIGGGLPTGWYVYSASTATSLGTLANYSGSLNYGIYRDTACGTSNVVGGGFKNYASANTATEGIPCDTQKVRSDRALGVRQVTPSNASHPNLDSGAAFVLRLVSTKGMSAVGVNFKLQSLDTSSPRVTTWRVEYRIGSTGAFTSVATTGTMTTGGHVFSNNNITASFGTALDNILQPVTIRIVTLDFSTGSGNRASTAIDDFNLTWTGSASTSIEDVNNTNAAELTVLGDATNSNVTFGFTAANGDYTLAVYDLAGKMIHTQNIVSTGGEQQVAVNGLNLVPGMYVAKMSNGITTGVTKVMVK